MKDEQNNAMVKAWDEFINKPETLFEATTDLAEHVFRSGYAAGQPQWTPIETEDDLPKMTGEYLWQSKDGTFRPREWPSIFEPSFFVSHYVAYQKIQPYKQEGE